MILFRKLICTATIVSGNELQSSVKHFEHCGDPFSTHKWPLFTSDKQTYITLYTSITY